MGAPDTYPLYLVSSDGNWERLMPTLESFERANQKVVTSKGYRIWFKDAFYPWSCGFCPRAFPRFLNIYNQNYCQPQDCINVWKTCIEENDVKNTDVSAV